MAGTIRVRVLDKTCVALDAISERLRLCPFGIGLDPAHHPVIRDRRAPGSEALARLASDLKEILYVLSSESFHSFKSKGRETWGKGGDARLTQV